MDSLDLAYFNSVNKHFNNSTEEPNPIFGFNVGIRIGFGGKNFNYNSNISVGIQQSATNLKASAFAMANIFGGSSQLGVSSKSKLFNFDLSAGAYVTAGISEGKAHNFYVLNFNSPSPFKNTFDSSLTFGQLITYNSAINKDNDGPEIQTVGLFGLQAGENFSLSYSIDATSAPTFAGLFRKSLGVLNTDAGWTGALSINVATVEFGYQNFSGFRTNQYPGNGVNSKYSQTKYHRSLNKASNYIQYNGVRFEYFGDAWLQNLIHNHVSKESTYDYDYINRYNISREF